MLVIANGAPKSGSTWLFNIIQKMHAFADVPEDYLLDKANPNSEIVYERLGEFLDNVDYQGSDYLLKNHFGKPGERDLIQAASDVLVVNIKRDLKDAVVSAYYHDLRQSGGERSFDDYYWKNGRFMADLIRRYHRVWESRPNSHALMVSYEYLKENTLSEILGIARFLGLDLSQEAAEAITEATSMSNLRKKYDDGGEIKFFRKGEVGDWKNHFNDRQLADIERIEAAGLGHASIGQRAYAKGMAMMQRA